MKIALVCVEDGLMSVGVRKMAGLISSVNPDTQVYYVPYQNYRALSVILMGRYGECADVSTDCITEIAEGICDADIVGFSSMTAYSALTASIISEVRRLNPKSYIIWGGIHPIIVPEDAIQHADAICTGEGEFAFLEFYEAFKAGEDFTTTKNFWFRQGDRIIKNGFRPLMSGEEMSCLPQLHYGQDELVYSPGEGFVPMTRDHYLDFNGLSYNTVWSIGCPFKCTYCGNTKFIDNDKDYRKIRHPSVDYIMTELERALSVHPHISTVVFHDDSFLALPTKVLAEFAQQYRERIGVPFAIQGVIPNYVKEPKIQLLLSAGLNRVRMGIQNGSERILEFYDRPTPPEKIRSAAETLSKYSRYMIPPAYDIILDNPIETREDIHKNLDLLYELARPYTLNIYSLRTIPNTHLEKQLEDLEISIDEISANYTHNAPTLANCLVYLIAAGQIPKWLFSWLKSKARPLVEPQRHYPRLTLLCRFVYLARRALDHLRFMDFSVLTGKVGYLVWKSGLLNFWHRRVLARYELPDDFQASAKTGRYKSLPVR